MPTGPRRDILLDSSGNRVLVNGDYGFAADEQAVKQGIQVRALLYLNDVWYNLDLGVPYLESVLIKGANPIVVKAEIGRNIALTPDVTNVVAVSLVTDDTTRHAAVNYTCNSTLGTVTGTVATGGA